VYRSARPVAIWGNWVGEEQTTGPVLFPNPATDQLIVGERVKAEAQVLDTMGRMLWQGRIMSDRRVLDVGS